MRIKELSRVLVFLCFILIASCKKDSLLTDSSAKLDFSEDTIMFDTVFATVGSTTQYLLIYNNNNRPINVSHIRLAGGISSNFRINVNGSPGTDFTDLEIKGKDSLWIFIEVTIDPNNQATPYIVADSIMFETNGNLQNVNLVAFGQNAHFIIPNRAIVFPDGSGLPYSIIGSVNDTDIVPCGTVIEWDSLLPYVVYGYAVVDSCTTLKIKEGTKIHFYNNSGLWVYRYGNLLVEGTKEHPVEFSGTRLEASYDDVPDQWNRIWVNEGGTNKIDHAIIKNSYVGIQAEDVDFDGVIGNAPTSLSITNSVIKNASYGILARTFDINPIENNVIANCKLYCVALTQGGTYNFKQNTIADYWRFSQRTTPAFFMNDWIDDGTSHVHIPLTVSMDNSIIYGNIDNEIEMDLIDSTLDTYQFKNCAVKVDETVTNISTSHFTNTLKNSDPQFEETTENNYHLKETSPCIDAGDASLLTPNLAKDLDGENRPKGVAPDLGAYEKK